MISYNPQDSSSGTISTRSTGDTTISTEAFSIIIIDEVYETADSFDKMERDLELWLLRQKPHIYYTADQIPRKVGFKSASLERYNSKRIKQPISRAGFKRGQRREV